LIKKSHAAALSAYDRTKPTPDADHGATADGYAGRPESWLVSSVPPQARPQSDEWRAPFRAPTVSLPTGGGAIRGIGEKFAANPVNGSATFSIPLPASPGRGGFGPQLALSYDSAAGNGPFGFGWSLDLPAIVRKTDRGLPRYRDDTDRFLLSGFEDLVPALDAAGDIEDDNASAPGYVIRRYRPRIEGGFARIERWTRRVNRDVHWRSISAENVLSVFGADDAHRIRDPDDASRIFSWLLSETRDDKGNAVIYDFKGEDGHGLDLDPVHERGRDAASRAANKYIERIRYGNAETLLDPASLKRPRFLTLKAVDDARWMFELVFDYGTPTEATPDSVGPWTSRPDPFSSCRAGFEVRTYRRCSRVLMFHDFPTDPEVGPHRLVRSLDLSYRTSPRDNEASDPGHSFLEAATQWSYQRDAGAWHRRRLPPVEFGYSEVRIDDRIREVDRREVENLPVGLGAGYQWIDLDGEGLAGVLTEQAGEWYYKPNLGGGDSGPRFGAAQPLAAKPAVAALAAGRQQLLDVQGDGTLDLVDFDAPLAGFQTRDSQQGWKPFVPFAGAPNLDWHDPNLRFVDLTGDGLADALLTDSEVLTWYPSRGGEGFGPAATTPAARDERSGPRIVFADQDLAVYIADMSGDGLADIVRIRNGQVCYWPSLGYGRFGAQVVMGGSPTFDHPDGFEQRRIRLADIDGSGTTDLIYLGQGRARVWFNRSGNEWGAARELPFPVPTANINQIQAADLLGNGTACLIWSSDLPADSERPIRYLDLMGGDKPHLMVEMRNNLGSVTKVDYVASTSFYLRDKAAGTPWAGKLPFPVHCVARVTVTDAHRKTAFTKSYSYHHGHFDGFEREFRGFGRVEEVDTQRFDEFAAANRDSPFVAADQRLYQPPVKTVTWFHTGLAVDRGRILGMYEQEYFPSRYADRLDPAVSGERELPHPELEPPSSEVTAGEWLEAMRACKGMPLRREVMELDVDALKERGEHVPVRLFSAEQHGCHIRLVQPRGPNPHAVFLATESEVLTYHYELALGGQHDLEPDPRIAHTLNLRFDVYGRVLQAVEAVYPRRGRYDDPALGAQELALIHAVQNDERHLGYVETRFTDELSPPEVDLHRLPAPCEVRTYELTGIDPAAGEQYLSLERLREYRLSTGLDAAATRAVTEIGYDEQPPDETPHKRLVEHAATLYFADDLTGPLALGLPGRHGLAYETYKLALTGPLIDAVLTGFAAEARIAVAAPGARPGFLASGYQKGSAIFGAGAAAAGTWWLRSGVAGFAADAASHFYLPERYLDALGNETKVEFDGDDLFVASSSDALGNAVGVEAFDHRVLAPVRLKDPNANVTEVAFDIRGLAVATALMGKLVAGAPETGDSVASLSFDELNPSPTAVVGFFDDAALDEVQARRWLGQAGARFVYHFGEAIDAAGTVTWAVSPSGACGIARERHEGDLDNDHPELGEDGVPIQVAFEYSDGAGQTFVKKLQAEPAVAGGPPRWIANGRTVMNNKGKPVLQYEPYFSAAGHRFAEPAAAGVSPIMFYDAADRLIRTEFPDGTISRVEVSPWMTRSFDQSDTVLEPGNRWYAEHTAPTADAHERRAARIAGLHAGTPAEVHRDSLGRDVVSIAHNRTPSDETALANTPLLDRPWDHERVMTFTKLDAEGKPLWICDARGNLVMQYIAPPRANRTALYDPQVPDHRSAYAVPAGAAPAYDVAGNLLFQHSMDAGDRWTLNDATGRPMRAWDANVRTLDDGTTRAEDRRFEIRYDALRRPVEQWLAVNAAAPALIEAFDYLDTAGLASAAALAAAQERNMIGQAASHYDPSGLATVERVDVHGAAEEVTRTLIDDVAAAVVDWDVADRAALLEPETFIHITEHDALGRTVTVYNWHRDDPMQAGVSDRVAVYEPEYNERGLLTRETLHVRAAKSPGADGRPSFTPDADPKRNVAAITRLTWNAKGQRETLELGNGTTTRYAYDPATFRLVEIETSRVASLVQKLHHTYDPVGNVTHIQDDAQDTIWFANQQVEPSSDYLYDAQYRLIEATGRENMQAVGAPAHAEGAWPTGGFPSPDATRNYTQRFRYDAVGNVQTLRHIAGPFPGQAAGSWTLDYAYAFDDSVQPASNRLWQTWTGGDRTQAVTYGHDHHGSMLNLANTAPGLNIRWDWRDMIRALDLLGGGNAFYSYGIDEQRTRKRIDRGGDSEDRVYLGGYELYRRRDAQGKLIEEMETHHLAEGDRRVLLVDDVLPTNAPLGLARRNGPPQTLFRYQYGNLLDSVGAELDDTARVIAYEEFHPYGTAAYRLARTSVEAPPRRYRYAGMERDEESGLSYHGARFFSPWLCRWTGCDPREALNRYEMCASNPLTFTDRDGRAPKCAGDPACQFDPEDPADTDRLRAKLGPLADSPESWHQDLVDVLKDQIAEDKYRNTASAPRRAWNAVKGSWAGEQVGAVASAIGEEWETATKHFDRTTGEWFLRASAAESRPAALQSIAMETRARSQEIAGPSIRAGVDTAVQAAMLPGDVAAAAGLIDLVFMGVKRAGVAALSGGLWNKLGYEFEHVAMEGLRDALKSKYLAYMEDQVDLVRSAVVKGEKVLARAEAVITNAKGDIVAIFDAKIGDIGFEQGRVYVDNLLNPKTKQPTGVLYYISPDASRRIPEALQSYADSVNVQIRQLRAKWAPEYLPTKTK
jgi:RHS repeat-associated protein